MQPDTPLSPTSLHLLVVGSDLWRDRDTRGSCNPVRPNSTSDFLGDKLHNFFLGLAPSSSVKSAAQRAPRTAPSPQPCLLCASPVPAGPWDTKRTGPGSHIRGSRWQKVQWVVRAEFREHQEGSNPSWKCLSFHSQLGPRPLFSHLINTSSSSPSSGIQRWSALNPPSSVVQHRETVKPFNRKRN